MVSFNLMTLWMNQEVSDEDAPEVEALMREHSLLYCVRRGRFKGSLGEGSARRDVVEWGEGKSLKVFANLEDAKKLAERWCDERLWSAAAPIGPDDFDEELWKRRAEVVSFRKYKDSKGFFWSLEHEVHSVTEPLPVICSFGKDDFRPLAWLAYQSAYQVDCAKEAAKTDYDRAIAEGDESFGDLCYQLGWRGAGLYALGNEPAFHWCEDDEQFAARAVDAMVDGSIEGTRKTVPIAYLAPIAGRQDPLHGKTRLP